MAGADLKKKKKKRNMLRSMKASDFEFRKDAPCKRTAPIRNYMKPTSSSESRQGKFQATVSSPAINDSKGSPRKPSFCSPARSCSNRVAKVLSRQSSLKPVRSAMKKSLMVGPKKYVNRATCSSTLKDFKFPAALELSCGATEAEGTSKMRVCPYTYCSLNGHIHDPLPPLKHFISARRKFLSANTAHLEMEAEKIDGKFEGDAGKVVSDLFVEIYEMREEENIGDEGRGLEQSMLDEVEDERGTMSQMNESSEISFEYDYDMDQNSEISHGGMDDAMMSFLENTEYDHEGHAQQGYEFAEDGEIVDIDWKEEIGLMPDNSEGSECPDGLESKEEDSLVIEKEDSLRNGNRNISGLKSQIMKDGVLKNQHEEYHITVATNQEHSNNFEDVKFTPEKKICQSDEINLGDTELNNLEKEQDNILNDTAGNKLNVSAINCREFDEFNKLSTRWIIRRRTTTEGLEQVKEFNPQAPHFLPLEPDPEAEKVDLKHQMMDERKNAEEWMIDYALQRAVTKLGPARKRKVALLVEAFETVVPLPMCPKPLSHGASTFTHLRSMQACS